MRDAGRLLLKRANEQYVGAARRSVQGVLKGFHRPSQEPKPKSSRGRFGGKLAPRLPHAEQAEDRWYDEGGNTQTRVARRALRT
jgi:hypothetical protein